MQHHGLHLLVEGARYGLRLDTALEKGVVVACSRGPMRLKGGRSAWPDLAAVLDREWAGRTIESLAIDTSARAMRLQLGPEDRLWFCWLRRGGTLLAECGDEPFRAMPGDRLEEVLSALASARPQEVGFARGGCQEPLGAADEWYQAAVVQAELDHRRQGLLRILRGENKRARRALAAIAREDAASEDPPQIRRKADALMAAGPAARMDGRGSWVVPDPWEGGEFCIPAHPPGASVHECAERIYRKARKSERGEIKRRQRRGQLEKRLESLRLVELRLEADGDEEALAAVEEKMESMGIAARKEHLAVSSAARKGIGRGEKAARVLRSPAGHTVLVGRSAMQNDRLTFKVAGPEDWWLHVIDRPGSHVVLRVEKGRPVSEEDLLFAAKLAAAWSSAPEGEHVDVHLARRKHIRKPRGAPPGAVSVRKSRTLRVAVPAR